MQIQSVVVAGIALCVLALPARSDIDSIIVGDVYVYTAPGVYVDITAALHEDPVYLLNGVEVLVVPDYSNDVVYDGNGNIIGFVGS
jgi:signal peptidase I